MIYLEANNMAVLYGKPHYNEACYGESEVYVFVYLFALVLYYIHCQQLMLGWSVIEATLFLGKPLRGQLPVPSVHSTGKISRREY